MKYDRLTYVSNGAVCYRGYPNLVVGRLFDLENQIESGDLIQKTEKGYGNVRATVEDVAERIKMAFYYEFDELIPSTMADKIDEIVKEVLNEHEL